MAPLLHHALLGVALLALGAAALRLASPVAGAGLARAITSVTFAAAAAVTWALALGLAGLGGSTAALVVAAVVTWAGARALLPQPDIALGEELGAWWLRRPRVERALLGGLGGAALAWALWQLRHPAIGFDSMHYHLPEIVLWVQGGHPGAVESLLPGLPVG